MKLYSARKPLIVTLILIGTTTLFAGYIEDRRAAVNMMRKGEVHAALEAFNEMAQGEVTALQKSDALEQAVRCLIRLKEYEAARTTADRIPIAGVADLCRMYILAAEGKHEALIERFGDAKIEEWPPMWRGQGYRYRGSAAHRMGRGKLAASDLEKAVLFVATFDNPNNEKSRILNTLGATYRDLLNDPESAIGAFRRAQQVGRGPKSTTSTFAIADIYLEQDQPARAVAVVKDWTQELGPEDMPGAYWQKRLLASMLRVFVAAGREDEAVAVCREALGMEKLDPGVKEYVREQLAELQGSTKPEESSQ